ncbi:hypothetical protein [Emticicia sp. 17c]|uniref:hypothetical protein n=1 Tax=Emticicia sp. 17c TaxID=3127704 RepID=UPI00301B80A8
MIFNKQVLLYYPYQEVAGNFSMPLSALPPKAFLLASLPIVSLRVRQKAYALRQKNREQ